MSVEWLKVNKPERFGACADCSKCHKPMSAETARIQIENKRENAPICVPCITGHKRTITRCGTKL